MRSCSVNSIIKFIITLRDNFIILWLIPKFFNENLNDKKRRNNMPLNFICTKCRKTLSSLTVPDNAPADVLRDTRTCPYCGGVAMWMKEPRIKLSWQCPVCKTRFKTEEPYEGISRRQTQGVCPKCGSWAFQHNWWTEFEKNRFKYYLIILILMGILAAIKFFILPK
jgi:hypothetical protein